jgi:hypothetical protein
MFLYSGACSVVFMFYVHHLVLPSSRYRRRRDIGHSHHPYTTLLMRWSIRCHDRLCLSTAQAAARARQSDFRRSCLLFRVLR